nr:hypothetical protein GCM10020093_053890 [Planobispora longispora]
MVSEDVPPSRVAEVVNVSSDPGWHAARLNEYAELGFEEIYLHHVGKEQEAFIDTFGAKVLPQLT